MTPSEFIRVDEANGNWYLFVGTDIIATYDMECEANVSAMYIREQFDKQTSELRSENARLRDGLGRVQTSQRAR